MSAEGVSVANSAPSGTGRCAYRPAGGQSPPSPGLSNEVALRIGLATRELDGICTQQMIDVLIAIMGKPITVRKLSRLRFNPLKKGLDQHCAKLAEEPVRQALAFLKGKGISLEPAPLPPIQPYRKGDMGESVRVACSSDHGHMIDGQFATCKHFLIYQVSADAFRLIDIREPRRPAEGLDKHSARASTIEDCNVLCTTLIGSPAASKVVKAGIHPIKVQSPLPAAVFIRELQQVLRDSPPPWLAKAMAAEAPLPETGA